MKKMIGIVALCVFGLAMASFAQAPCAAPAAEVVAAPAAEAIAPAVPVEAPVAEAVVEAVAAPVEAAVEAIAAPVEAAVEAPVAAAEQITVKGEVSVVNGPDGALQAVYINPADPESHGYKVDIVNGEGKTLADKDGKIVEAVGTDANRLFTIQSIVVAE